MMHPLRSLLGKLLLTLIVLLAINSVLFMALAVLFTRHHAQAIEQRLGQGLAGNILAQGWLPEITDVGTPVEMVFDRLMGVNPSIELYRIDRSGRILDYSAPEGRVVRDHVAIEPVMAFLNGGEYPILGDDPRSATGRKVFSAAPISRDGEVIGYLYVVVGSEAYESVSRMLEDDYVLQLSLVVVGSSALLSIAAGFAAFHFLSKRFRRLSAEMRRFGDSNFRRGAGPRGDKAFAFRDEIDELDATFRRMSDLISAQIRMLEQADESRREMIANISHDLRTPLATLSGFLETMQMKETELDDDTRRRYLQLASEYAVRLSGRIGELFELSTLEAPAAPLDMMPFSVAELAQDMTEKLTLSARRKGITFATDISPDTPFVLGDIGLIERVFEKLIENALRFTPSGGRVAVTIAAADGGLVARVDDSGPGIAAEDLPQIFDRFYQGNKARPGVGSGAGLGLAIARRIVELHGGRIGAENRHGGASFYFVLPPAP